MSFLTVINYVDPKPIAVSDGEMITLRVGVVSAADVDKARLVITNRQPKAANLFDSNEHSDRIRSNQNRLTVGQNEIEYDIGFNLEGQWAQGGAVLTISLHLENHDQEQISPSTDIVTAIAAKS